MHRDSLTKYVLGLAILSLLPSGFAASQPKDQIAIEKEGVQLIGQVREAARDINYNADRLNAFTKSVQISKWTHYHHLTEIRTLVNEGLQPAFDRLTEIQPQLPEWKQKSINDMLQSAKVLAADVHSAILSKNDAGTTPPYLNSEYKELVVRILQHSDTLMKTAATAQTFAEAKLKADLASSEAQK